MLRRAIDQLPDKGECIWQGVWIRLPGWVEEDEARPARPWAFLWVNPAVDLLNPTEGVQLGPARPTEVPLRELVDFARNVQFSGSRPTTIAVNHEELAKKLTRALDGMSIAVLYEPDLSIVKALQESFYEFAEVDSVGEGILGGQGVTIERVRSFADAAARFYAVAPWEYLNTNDPLTIKTDQRPAPGKDLSNLVVMGAEGRMFGLAFYDSLDQFQTQAFPAEEPEADPSDINLRQWSVLFGPMPDLVVPDADLWEDEELPVAGEEAYPLPVRFLGDGDIERPDASVLLHMEACLRALTSVTEEKLDAGRFEHVAATCAGPVKITMTLPFILEPPSREQVLAWGFEPDRRAAEKSFDFLSRLMEEREFASVEDLQQVLNENLSGKKFDDLPGDDSPQGQARELCFQAYDSIGWRKRQLARKALALDPACAEAYVLLGEEMPNPNKALAYYEQGMVAGERMLGRERFEVDAGQFWSQHDTRPYMRARTGVARNQILLGRRAEACGHYWALLDLDRSDHQGLRHEFLLNLMETKQYEEAFRLLDRFPEEEYPSFPYARALLLYRRDGDTPATRLALRAALGASRPVADLLLHPRKREKMLEDPEFEFNLFSLDPVASAYSATFPLLRLYESMPEARTWLQTEMKRGRGTSRSGKTGPGAARRGRKKSK